MVQPADIGSGSPGPVGFGERVVQEGECAISIADASGHFWQTLWNHPGNAELKAARGSPHVLLAGDQIHVPEIRAKQQPGASGRRHTFKRKGIPVQFEISVEENGKPLNGNRYILKIEDRITSGTVGGDGVIRAPMMPQDKSGELRIIVENQTRVYPLSFGRLDPAHTQSGAHGRLYNLGYAGSDLDDHSFAEALKEFQKENQLDETGELDSATASRLASVHGS